MSIDTLGPEFVHPPVDRIVLQSDKDSVVLKQLVPEDAPALFKLVDESRRHLNRNEEKISKKYKKVEDVVDSIENPQDFRNLQFGVWDGDTMVGSVSMLFLQDLGIGAISFWIGKKHTGNNFAARGNDLLIDYAFNQMGLKTLQSQVHIKNIASQRTVERSGFKFTKINGKWKEYELRNPNPPIR